MATYEPASEAELAAIVHEAAAAGQGLAIAGGGTRGVGEPVAGERLPTALVSTTGLSGITVYEPGALTLVARAGTPVAEVEAVLAAEGQMLPFEPWDGRPLSGVNGVPTVGGMVATNASGPRRIAAGACRDLMIGVRFVDGTGAVVKNGGRVMKNVTGLDLVKLMAGSRGTLGILTEVAFKVLPRPEVTTSLVLDGLGLEAAGAAMRAAMASPCDVSAAAHASGRTLLRLEGFEVSVRHRARVLAAALADFGLVGEDREVDWAAIRDASAFAGREGAVWRLSVRPTDGPAAAARLPGTDAILDWAGGRLTLLAPAELDVRAALAGISGHATLLRAGAGAPSWPVLPPEPAPLAAIAAGLRARFDPQGILNPGRMDAVAA